LSHVRRNESGDSGGGEPTCGRNAVLVNSMRQNHDRQERENSIRE